MEGPFDPCQDISIGLSSNPEAAYKCRNKCDPSSLPEYQRTCNERCIDEVNRLSPCNEICEHHKTGITADRDEYNNCIRDMAKPCLEREKKFRCKPIEVQCQDIETTYCFWLCSDKQNNTENEKCKEGCLRYHCDHVKPMVP